MEATAKLTDSRISFKSSLVLSRELKGLKVERAARLLEGLLSEKENIDGKHYTNAAKVFLGVLKSAEANARQKNLDTEKLFVKIAKADRAKKFVRPKSRSKFRGRKAKATNLLMVLEER